MMRKVECRPSWWLLYLLWLVLIGLLFLGAWASMSQLEHQAAAIGTILLGGGLTEVWLRANCGALLHVEGLTLVRQTRPNMVQDAPLREERQPAPGSQQPPEEGLAQTASISPNWRASRQETMAR